MESVEAKESVESMDITKLKVQELRKELKARGLSAAGNKNDLMERLQMAHKNKVEDTMSAESVDDLDEDLLNDEDDEHIDEGECVLNDLDSPVDALSPVIKVEKRKSSDADVEAPKPPKKIVLNRNVTSTEEKTEGESTDHKTVEVDKGTGSDKKVIKLSELSAKERLEMRAKKFGLPVSGDVKLMVRAERFNSQSTQSAQKTPITITPSDPATVQSLKHRAQRFGVSVSTALMKLENQERMEKRKKRFGVVTNGKNNTPTDKAQARLEKFKEPVN